MATGKQAIKQAVKDGNKTKKQINAAVGKYTDNTINVYLTELTQEGELQRVGRGVYDIPAHERGFFERVKQVVMGC